MSENSKMTDLEITRLCAKAMKINIEVIRNLGEYANLLVYDVKRGESYDPLYDDAQARALEWYLIEHHGALHFYRDHLLFYPYTGKTVILPYTSADEKRRAICECVAKSASVDRSNKP